MKNRHTSTAFAPYRNKQIRQFLQGSLLGLGAFFAASALFAEGHETIIETHAFSNFGEVKYPADFPHLDYVNPDAPKGGEIAQWAQGTFDSFNNFSRKGVAAALNSLPYEGILTGTADDPYGAYCYMCTTMEYPESLDWVIFNLRDDITFSDGRPLTAEDVKFTHELFMEQGITEYRNVVQTFVESVEVLGPYEVKFNFAPDAPRRDVIGVAGGGSALFSKSWFEETGTRLDEPRTEPFLGTGPYVLQSVDIGRQIIYERNPNWWASDLPINVGRNNFDTIRVEYFADSAAALEGFKSGAYTFRNENSSKEWATSYDFPAMQDGLAVKKELPDGSIGYAQAFVFNLDSPKWQDRRVRQAIGLMFNFEWSNQTLFYGLYERVNSFWENSDLEATGVPTPTEVAILKPLVDEGLLDPSILTDEPVMAPTSSSADRPLDRRNLRAASALLDEAGWVAGDDGMRAKDGVPLDMVILSTSPAFDRIINPYVENLKRLGVNAILDRVDRSQYVDRRRSGDFDMVGHGFGMGFEPGTGLRQWYGSETADDSSRNLMRLRSEAIDRLLTVVIEAKTLAELKPAVHALDRALRAEGFWVQQWFKNKHTVAYYDMFRHPEELPPYALGELDFWWYDAEAGEALKAAGAFQ
ncbi:extracellular solute-binding protein [Yoonia sediminilitoris]|uniref:Microcin C transport system substrate-binding protein n=1 Tax=Yoonia sediminilitoris TaxID=1286148 RepID=A0A2T6K7H6_9RHOB|nr:extracellular solute-binding protein [Yoonia sediminilitoris]PUB10669.1 microcin C transport system substrate-binding protein [Yoonia sediminilitoris]RCW90421.1 microcin C transport system substrate-binding protein [Yoonia sediminilitoris]